MEEQTDEVMKRHMDRNTTYVQIALETLKENLTKSEDPRVITFGSQWSYRSGNDCPEMIPYAMAKNALMKYTQKFALANPKIRANHYCVPSSETFSFRRIQQTLKQIDNKKMVVSHGNLANPEIVADNLIDHALKFNDSGKTLLVKPSGLIELLK